MATVTKCGQCGQLTDGDANFCEGCGGQLAGTRKATMIDAGMPRSIVIGRDESCTYQIDKPTVSLQHALLEVLPGGGLRVKDLGSTNGVGVNSPSNRILEGPIEVHPWDKLYLGRTEVPVRDVLFSTAEGGHVRRGKVEATAIKMRGTSMVFGRDPQSDFQIPHPMVSARHACLTREGNQYFVEDLGSTNGTFVRGRRLPAKTKVPIKVGDEIGFGSYTLVLNDLGYVQRKATGKEITVTAENLAVHVPSEGGSRELLGEVSLTIEPGDLVALMGPSGAGKTTFMCALNGITQPSRGRVMYRNLDLADNFDLFRTMIGYVPQDDIMHAQLTVYKALYYTAKLRLPADYTDEQIDQRIRRVLADVGLEDKIDTVIGDSVRKSLSGGQRKRVNLAMELLSEPWVMFLDEPTSGLSALDARTVVELLRTKLADQGRTIIVTIHQPSLDVYSQFNLLAMISNHPPKPKAPRVPGRLVYFGPAMDAFQFFSPKSESAGSIESPKPEEIEAGLLKKPVDEWVKRYNRSSYKKIYVGERRKILDKNTMASLPSPHKDRFRQLAVLCQRLAELKIRDRAQLIIALALPLLFGVLVALSEKGSTGKTDYRVFAEFGRRTGTAHFLMVVAAMWFGCNNAIREIVGERAIYRRERLVNLSLSSYFLSKYVVLGALGLLQCLLMLSIVHLSLGLRAEFLQILLTLWITAIAGSGVGLCISSIMSSNEQAIACLPLALLPMIVLGGCLTTVSAMGQHEPLGWLADFAPTRWAYEANFVLENDAQGSDAQFPKANRPQEQLQSYGAQNKALTDKLSALQNQAEGCQRRVQGFAAAANTLRSKAVSYSRSQDRAVNGTELSPLAASSVANAKRQIAAVDLDAGSDAPRGVRSADTGAGQTPADNAQNSSHDAAPGYEDMADQQFPSDGKGKDSIPRHTWLQALSRLGAMAVFWAMATLVMLKKDEWEWWRSLATQLKLK